MLSEPEARQKDSSIIDAWEHQFGIDWTSTFGATGNLWDATKKRHFEQTPTRVTPSTKQPKTKHSITSGKMPQFNVAPKFNFGGTVAPPPSDSRASGKAVTQINPVALLSDPIVNDEESLTDSADLAKDQNLDVATIIDSVSGMSIKDTTPSDDANLTRQYLARMKMLEDITRNGLGSKHRAALTTPFVLKETISKNAEALEKAYGHSLSDPALTALDLKGMPCDNWVLSRKQQSVHEFVLFLVDMVTMLAGIPNIILKHLVLGDIPKEGKTNRELRNKLNDLLLHRSDDGLPCIYIQYLTDSAGESPTAATLTSILDDVELYIRGYGNPADNDSYKFAMNVDSTARRDQGKRKYITKPEQINVTRRWVTVTRTRIQRYPPNVPLQRPLSEVGWAKNLQERLTQHAKHQSSNYLMNLTESICRVKYKDYGIRQYGIFRIFETEHAMLGEILCSRIAQAYTSHGGGFSHHSAGISTPGAYKLGEDVYRNYRIETYDDPEWQQNMKEAAVHFDYLREKLKNSRKMELGYSMELGDRIGEIFSIMKQINELTLRSGELTSTVDDEASTLVEVVAKKIPDEQS